MLLELRIKLCKLELKINCKLKYDSVKQILIGIQSQNFKLCHFGNIQHKYIDTTYT